jgi:hypothetical protein
MKNSSQTTEDKPGSNARSKLKFFLNRQSDKLKHGRFTCPLCREVFTGIAQLGSHLKQHCT